MSNFTPGPWKFKYCMNIDGAGIMEAEFDVTVDDLKIIGAAPEMKDLLWDAWQDLNALSNGDQSCDARYEATETMEKIMSLLRRIEGKEETE